MRTPRESLQILLYLLARNHMPAASVNSLVIDVSHWGGPVNIPQLEHLASEWTDRLIGKEEAEPEYRFGLFCSHGHRVDAMMYLTQGSAEDQKLGRDGIHVRRGQISEMETFRDVEWEAEPYA
jgi:hypothetical protein